jgi:hypothetical protein
MNVNLELMKKVAEQSFLPATVKAHGEQGEILLKKILEIIPRIYQYISPETHKKPIVIFKLLSDEERILPEDQASRVTNVQALTQIVKEGFIVQHLDNEQLLVWNYQILKINEIAQKGIVYLYSNEKEYFFAKDSKKLVEKLILSYPSSFCIPTFRNLKEAIEDYKTTQIRCSSCKIFNNVWHDKNRLFFKNGPEEIIRNSLTQFLKIVLRGDAEVRPEQVVDETHPIDIKVTWSTAHKLALIEIKWLGQSRDSSGHITNRYTAVRARKGAKQLAEYLEANKSQAPTHITLGYLVTIDGRRKGLNETTVSLSRDHGFYYEKRDIVFDPKYHETRSDFEIPIRMFVEPIFI